MQHITILLHEAIRFLKMLVLSHNEHVLMFDPRKVLVSIQKAREKPLMVLFFRLADIVFSLLFFCNLSLRQ